MPSARPATPRPAVRLSMSLFSAIALPAMSCAETAVNYGDLSLEELMNETVTSVSKKEQKRTDAPAAISTLSNEDLQRSGATTVAEALRWVPGLQVGSANSHEWAVSSRGFNLVFANKLLVLVDGRAVYSPIFSGVYWDLQQTMLEDVDRIEVIRGPGATIWGANAVDGVVNIVTRSARDTQGGFVYGGGGDVRESLAGARYGGRIGEKTFYRVFTSYQSSDDHPLSDGSSAGDHWLSRHGGFRVDHYPDPDSQLTWQAGATEVESIQSDGYNVNTLGRWTRRTAGDAGVEVQAYYDRTYRDESARSAPLSDTIDLSAQHTFAIGDRNEVIWGGGYRFIENDVKQSTPANQVRDGRFDLNIVSLFAQDELTLVPDRLILTGGLKVEHNDYTGFEFQPSIRGVFKPAPNQTLWAAISRAVRTPSALEGRDLFAIGIGPPVTGPGGGLYAPAIVGNTDIRSEKLWAYEMGYRIQPTSRLNVDLAAFFNDHRDLMAYGETSRFVPGTPVGTLEIPWENAFDARVYGGEAAVTLAPTDQWRLTAGYSLTFQHADGDAATVAGFSRNPPTHQATLRSSHDFSKRAGLDVLLRYVDTFGAVPSYVSADIRIFYRVSDRLEIALVGQNLLDDRHPEQEPLPVTITSEVPRSVYGKVTCRF